MRIFSLEVTVWAVFVDLESEVTCKKYKTPGCPNARHFARSQDRIRTEGVGSCSSGNGDESLQEAAEVPEKRTGAPPAGGKQK